MPITTIALDLERTLIDDALSAQARPDLYEFLSFCNQRFERVAIFTTVEETDAREVMAELAARGHVPPELVARLEYIGWSRQYKDLSFIPAVAPREVLLVDDDAGWIRPDQREQWVPIVGWDGGPDAELARVQGVLETFLAGED